MVAGEGYEHVPTSPDYTWGGRSEMDLDLGLVKENDMASLQTVPGHIAGMLALSC